MGIHQAEEITTGGEKLNVYNSCLSLRDLRLLSLPSLFVIASAAKQSLCPFPRNDGKHSSKN